MIINFLVRNFNAVNKEQALSFEVDMSVLNDYLITSIFS